MDRGEYWAQNMMGVKDDRFKKGQISFAHKVLIRRISNLKADSLINLSTSRRRSILQYTCKLPATNHAHMQ